MQANKKRQSIDLPHLKKGLPKISPSPTNKI